MKVKLKHIFSRTKWFLFPYIVIGIVAFFFLLVNDKGRELILINSISNDFLDSFFLIITDFGLGGFVSILAGLLLLYNIRWSVIMFLGLGATGILTNLFKKIMFTEETRPLHFFYYDDFPRFIHDAPLIYYHSFPSGHTMTIFAFCLIITYLSGRPFVGVIAFLLALIVGISRIYLLQHFGNDVLAGSFLGIVAASISIFLVDFIIRYKGKGFPDKGLWHLFIKRRN